MTWTLNAVLLTAAPVLPIALVTAWLLPYLRRRMSVLLIVAPFPALAASVLAVGPAVTFWRGLVPMTLSLDVPRAILLGVCAILWVAAAIYSVAERHGRPVSYQFAVCWLLTLAGNVGVFVTADLASFFLSYTLVSIPAYGLITDDDTSEARRAGAVYMAYTVLGETLLLMAFALLAAATPGGTLTIRDVLAALAGSPWRGATLALLISGFGMKIGLVSLHVWMPLTYRAAPIPAASVLSGAAVNAGVIGLIRFLPFGVALPMAGTALATVGFFGALRSRRRINAGEPEDRAGLLQRKSDGVDRGGSWRGARCRRPCGGQVCCVLCRQSCSGEGCPVSRNRISRSRSAAAPTGLAVARFCVGTWSCRNPVDWWSPDQACTQGSVWK